MPLLVTPVGVILETEVVAVADWAFQSSYLDLSPLYGDVQADQDNIRTFKDGKLKPDCFSEERILGMPPACGVIL